MARPKKIKPETQPEAATNKAETTIIPDGILVKTTSKRRAADSIKKGEIVTVHNKINGATNQMAAEFALRLLSRQGDTYEILK